MLTDPEWWHAVRNTLFFTVVSVSLETILGLTIALVLHQQFAGAGLGPGGCAGPMGGADHCIGTDLELDAA